MNSQEISRKLRHYTRFLGVFPIDKIPKSLPFGHALIINLDRSNQPGSHWVALYKSVILEYFDPLGQPPPSQIDIKGPILYNKRKIQHSESVSCGPFAIDFVQRRFAGEDFGSIQKSYSNNQLFNDFLVV